jgi:RimJ/RimL family protein N-acetyltransferase
MDVTIAPIAAEHVESFHRALDCVARERRYLTFLEAPPLDSTRAFVMDNIANGFPQFVALANGKAAGWCDILPESREVRAHCGVLGLGLLPEFRGKGHGAALLKATLGAARRIGLVRIELRVYADNARAIALYEKTGFEKEGVMRDACFIGGQYRDLILMALIDPINRRPVWTPPGS